MSGEFQKCQETTENNTSPGVAHLFRAYRLAAEDNQKKLKEANTIIERLKDEINNSRDSESNLRSQLTASHNRLIYFQKTLKNFISVSERQRQNEKISRQIETEVEKIKETVKQTREQSNSFLRRVSRELELLKELKELKSILEVKNRDYDLLKMDIKTLTKQKDNVEAEYHRTVEKLKNELGILKQKNIEKETQYRETLRYYQEQLEEKEEKIKLYEKQQKSFLEDFEPPKLTDSLLDDFPLADSTVSIIPTERSPKGKHFESQMKSNNSNGDFQKSPLKKSKLITFRKKKDENSQKVMKKQKPQLEFLLPSQDTSQSTQFQSTGKMRLFSSNNYEFYSD